MIGRRTFLELLGASVGIGGQAAHAQATAVFTPPDEEVFDASKSPYPIVTVAGKDALARWEGLRDGKQTPIVLGSAYNANRAFESFAFQRPDPAEILRKASTLRFPQDWRAEAGRRWDEMEQLLRRKLETRSGSASPVGLTPEMLDELRRERQVEPEAGEWPRRVEPIRPLEVAKDYASDGWAKQVYIVLLPTADPTEAPAYLNWGGWNECPPPEHQVAALRYWRDTYGAVPLSMGADVLELKVARRPATRDEALALAREQYGFCVDIVDQGVDTISALAATLMVSDWWFFWWD